MADSSGALIGGLCGIVFVLVFAGIGAFLIYRSLQNRKRAEASQGWPSTLGVVAESRVTRSTSTDSEGDTSVSYSPHVEYTYQVGGKEYRGKDITFGFKQGYGSPAKAEEVTARYPEGGSVTVYYDPANPQKAVLERRAGGFGASLAIGIIFLAIGLCLACPGAVFLLAGMTSGGG
jgi:hypothetical protein